MTTEQLTSQSTAPEELTVAAFVRKVREQLADLPAEDQQELTEGLEADLTDQVAERNGGSLGDPLAYARELRVAAGFDPDMQPVRQRRGLAVRTDGFLDAAHAKWAALVDGLPGDPWGLLTTLRPAWWVLRAWIAVQLVDFYLGGGSYGFGLSPIPTVGGIGWLILLIAVVISVQIGRGKFWPGGSRRGFARVLLLVLNTFAIAMIPLTFSSVFTPAKAARWGGNVASVDEGYQEGYADGRGVHDREGMYVDGRWISQIYPYDAAGRPLVGVQLFDQTGDPVSVLTQTECVYGEGELLEPDQGRVYYPWTNGAAQVRNVFPVPSVVAPGNRPDPDPLAFQRTVRPSVGQFPATKVPPVSLPGLKVSRGVTPQGALEPGVRPDTPLNPIDSGC